MSVTTELTEERLLFSRRPRIMCSVSAHLPVWDEWRWADFVFSAHFTAPVWTNKSVHVGLRNHCMALVYLCIICNPARWYDCDLAWSSFRDDGPCMTSHVMCFIHFSSYMIVDPRKINLIKWWQKRENLLLKSLFFISVCAVNNKKVIQHKGCEWLWF